MDPSGIGLMDRASAAEASDVISPHLKKTRSITAQITLCLSLNGVSVLRNRWDTPVTFASGAKEQTIIPTEI